MAGEEKGIKKEGKRKALSIDTHLSKLYGRAM
jgi:hypothetical protein